MLTVVTKGTTIPYQGVPISGSKVLHFRKLFRPGNGNPSQGIKRLLPTSTAISGTKRDETFDGTRIEESKK